MNPPKSIGDKFLCWMDERYFTIYILTIQGKSDPPMAIAMTRNPKTTFDIAYEQFGNNIKQKNGTTISSPSKIVVWHGLHGRLWMMISSTFIRLCSWAHRWMYDNHLEEVNDSLFTSLARHPYRLDMETLGFRPIMPKNFIKHWSNLY